MFTFAISSCFTIGRYSIFFISAHTFYMVLHLLIFHGIFTKQKLSMTSKASILLFSNRCRFIIDLFIPRMILYYNNIRIN